MKCYECHSEDVVVEIRDLQGTPFMYLCREDWEAAKQFNEKIIELLYDVASP